MPSRTPDEPGLRGPATTGRAGPVTGKVEDERSLPTAPLEDPPSGPLATDEGLALEASASADGGLGDLTMLGPWLEQNAALARAHLELFCDESRKLKDKPLFNDRPRTRDAAQYLGVRVDWETTPVRIGLLHLAEPLRLRLASYGDGWADRITDSDLAGLDFGWMRELQAYDCWSLTLDGPLRDIDSVGWLDGPIPNFVSLMGWTKLRLSRALRDGQFAQASAEVRHLAYLTHSLGPLIADMVAIQLLRLERSAWEAASASGQDTSGWVPLEAAQLDRQRRVGLTAPYFLYPGVPEAVASRAADCASSVCPGIHEAIGAHAAFAEQAGHSNLALLEAAVKEHGCDQSLMKLLLQHPKKLSDFSSFERAAPTHFDRLFPPDAGPGTRQ